MTVNIDGMALADGVVETLAAMAVKDVEGVASLGASSTAAGFIAALQSKSSSQGIEVTGNEDNTISVAVRVEVYAGNVLSDVAAAIRQAVADAVKSQVGIEVKSVDVYIDGIQFA